MKLKTRIFEAASLRCTRSIVAGSVIATFVLLSSQVYAQESAQDTESITVAPSSESFKLNAGDTKRNSMEVINDGDVAFDFIVYARPYSVSNELYEPNFSTLRPNTDVQNWIQFEKTKFRLESGKKTTVNYTIRVPAGAAPGGHYGVLFAETQQQDLGTTGVARQKRVGNLIYATVNGNIKQRGAVKEFILPRWQTKDPFVSSIRATNTGNVDFDTKVSTVAKDVFGRTKFTYTGDPIVLPETTRLIEMKWDKAPSFGIFKVQQTIAYLGQTDRNSSYVLLSPKWFPIAVVVVLLIGAGYAILSYRKTKR